MQLACFFFVKGLDHDNHNRCLVKEIRHVVLTYQNKSGFIPRKSISDQ